MHRRFVGVVMDFMLIAPWIVGWEWDSEIRGTVRKPQLTEKII
jgi:hypothetical protein